MAQQVAHRRSVLLNLLGLRLNVGSALPKGCAVATFVEAWCYSWKVMGLIPNGVIGTLH